MPQIDFTQIMIMLGAGAALVVITLGGNIWGWISERLPPPIGTKGKDTTSKMDKAILLGVAFLDDMDKRGDLKIDSWELKYRMWPMAARGIARRGAKAYVDSVNIAVRRFAEENHPEGAVCDDLAVERFEHIGESLNHEIVSIIMISAEGNHYAERDSRAWDALVDEIVNDCNRCMIAWYGQRHKSQFLTWKKLSVMIDGERNLFDDHIRLTMERLRAEAITLRAKLDKIEEKRMALKAHYTGCIIRLEKPSVVEV